MEVKSSNDSVGVKMFGLICYLAKIYIKVKIQQVGHISAKEIQL